MSEPTKHDTIEVTAETFEEFSEKIKSLFEKLDEPSANRAMRVEFPAEEFPIMPMHVESQQTMTSINGKVIDLATTVMNAAKRRVMREKGVDLSRCKQFIIYPANIIEGERFLFRLTKQSPEAPQ